MSAGRCLIDRARLTHLAAAAFAQIDGRADAAHPAALQLAKRRAVGRAGADRFGPLATIVASVYAPHAFFESEVPELKDDQFAAWPGLQPRGPCVFGPWMNFARGAPVRGVCDDRLAFPVRLPKPPDAILCMGDTLTRLAVMPAAGFQVSRAAGVRGLVRVD